MKPHLLASVVMFSAVLLVPGSAFANQLPGDGISSILKQYANGVPLDNIQCKNPEHKIALRDNGKVVCSSDKLMQKLSLQTTLKTSSEKTNVIDVPSSDVLTLQTSQHVSSITHICAEYPKNISVNMPKQVRLGDEFIISYNHTFAIFDEDDEIVEQLEMPRSICYDDALFVTHSNKTAVLNPGSIIDYTGFDEQYRKTTHTTLVNFFFNNTADGQIFEIKMSVNDKLDHIDSPIIIGKNSLLHYVYPRVTGNIVTFYDVPWTQIDGFGSIDSINNTDGTVKKYPVDTTPEKVTIPTEGNEILPPIDKLAKFLETIDTDDLKQWLHDNTSFPSEYIKELLEAYPDKEGVMQFSPDNENQQYMHHCPVNLNACVNVNLDSGTSMDSLIELAEPLDKLDRRYEPYCIFYPDWSDLYACFRNIQELKQYQGSSFTDHGPYLMVYSNGTAMIDENGCTLSKGMGKDCQRITMLKPITINIKGKPYCIFYNDGSNLRKCFATMNDYIQSDFSDNHGFPYLMVYSNGTAMIDENGCALYIDSDQVCRHTNYMTQLRSSYHFNWP